jgi:hypothetical protein
MAGKKRSIVWCTCVIRLSKMRPPPLGSSKKSGALSCYTDAIEDLSRSHICLNLQSASRFGR